MLSFRSSHRGGLVTLNPDGGAPSGMALVFDVVEKLAREVAAALRTAVLFLMA